MFTCVLDMKESKTVVDFAYADEVIVDNPLEHDTDVTLVMNGRKSKV